MATVSSTIALEDKMTQTLTKIQKAGIENIQTFNNMQKEVDNLKKSLEDAEKANPKIVETKMYEEAAAGLEKMENKLYDVAHGNSTFEESNKKVKLSITDLNQALELCQKAWSGLNKVVDMAKEWSAADQIQKTAETQLATVMRQRMRANTEMIQSIKQLTSEQQQLGIIGDEVQLAGAKQVATFLSSKKSLETLIPAMNNLAANQYGYNASTSDMVSLGNMVGKVMQGQVGALTRAGVTFTEADKKILEYGNEEQRAATLAKVINDNVGQMNEALASTPYGAIQQANNKLSDMKETLGSKVSPYLAAFKELIVKAVAPAIQFLADNMNWLAPIFITIAAVIGVVIAVLTVYAIVNGIVALSELAIFWPLLLIIGAILLIIGVITAVVNIINQVTGSTISAVGVIMGILFVLAAFVFNTIILPIWNALVELVNFFANCFKDPVASIKVLFADMAIFVLQKLKNLVEGASNLIRPFAKVLGIDVNLSSGIDKLISGMEQYKEKVKSESGYEEVMQKKERWDYEDAYNQGYNFGKDFGNSIKNFGENLDLGKYLEGTGAGGQALDSVIGTDGSGGKALKTTTNDDLLSDEDMQLLLDIATRDYKLNYQQVTPNITLTFGDVHETADVDGVIDAVATQLEEIYDGNLSTA